MRGAKNGGGGIQGHQNLELGYCEQLRMLKVFCQPSVHRASILELDMERQLVTSMTISVALTII